ncbi:MAG: hypothetical protein IJV40_14550 [Oscillospiraceae bacterium]|nr:hypothetical protein [Oscillospiraceae bacterium]
MSMGIASAFADVTITVNRDSTYDDATGNRDYKWYRVFTATKNGTYTAEGGGYDSDGTPGTITEKTGSTATAFAYIATQAVAKSGPPLQVVV